MRKRLAFAVAILLAWVAGSSLGTIVPPQRAQAAPLFQLTKVRAGFTPTLDQSEPIFILFVGSDARPGQPIDGERTDSIHLVGINPAKGRASILGFPRDSWVEIPGYGSEKINSAMVYGGPELTVATVQQLTGITIDYYALTSFDGFSQMIDDIGGLTVNVPYAMHDSYSRADFDPGVQRLDGHDALAFARDRHTLISGDFGRSENQGRLFLAALQQFRKEFGKDPSRLLTWIGAGMRNIPATNVSLDEVITLALTASAIDPRHVANMVTPGGTGMVGSESVVYISAEAQAIYADMKGDGIVKPKNVPPSPETAAGGA